MTVIIVCDITLSGLDKEPEFQRVNVKVKIAHVAEVVTLDNNRKLQNVTVADESGTAMVTLWQNDVGKVVTGKTYIIENLMVKCYRGEWSLTSPKSGIVIRETESLPEVVEVSAQNNNIGTLKNARIIGVRNLQCYRLCPMCKNGKMDAKTQEQYPDIGACVECSSPGLISACELHMSSQLAVMSNNIQSVESVGASVVSKTLGVVVRD